MEELLITMGTTISICTSLSPIAPLMRCSLSADKNVDSIPISFLVLSSLNPLLWIIYAIIFEQYYMLPAQIPTFILYVCFCTWYNILKGTVGDFGIQCLIFGLFACPVVYYGQYLLGTILIVANTLPFIGLLEKLKVLIDTRDDKYAEILILMPNFCNATIWMSIAYLKEDFYLFTPNAIGVMACSLQFYLWLWAIRVIDPDPGQTNLVAGMFGAGF